MWLGSFFMQHTHTQPLAAKTAAADKHNNVLQFCDKYHVINTCNIKPHGCRLG